MKDLISILKTYGYKEFKIESSSTVSIITDKNRIDVLKDVEKRLKILKAKYDPNKGSSSIGAVVAGDFIIKARPANKQGKKSAGLDNEDAMIEGIKAFTKTGPITVRITDGRKKYTYRGVTDIQEVGRDTSGRKKADVRLITKTKIIPISIKKDNAEMWESADSYWAPIAKKIIDREVANKQAKLIKNGSTYKIVPNIAIKASAKEKNDVVFGSDIKGNGFVVVKTFSKDDFKLDKNGDILEIRVTKIIDSPEDLTGNSDIYFLIRNDSSRKGSKIAPGLRVLAVSGSRINKNVRIVKN